MITSLPWDVLSLCCNHSLPLRASKVFRRSTKCASVPWEGSTFQCDARTGWGGVHPFSLFYIVLVLVCEHVYGFLQSVLGAIGSLGIDNKVVGTVAHVAATHASVPAFCHIVPLE